jgi:DNA-binding transcriptional ArsR family regulator
MTPLLVTGTDEFRSLITFRTSTVYEMWLSLRALQNPGHRHQDWAERVRRQLPQDILEDLEFIYSRFEKGALLMELAVDYLDHHDVEGFLHYVEQMNMPQFLFYAVGRLAPAEEMAKLEPTMESLLSIVTDAFLEGSKYAERLRTARYLELLADPETYKVKLLRLWRRYWEAYFKEESKVYHQIWQESMKEKSLALSRQDALEFVKRLAGKSKLPDQIPEGYTTEEIILVPSYFGPHHLMFFGYGSITLIYDCQITEQRREELEKLEEEIIATAKALDDKTRLELLKWIVRDPHIYGRKLAEICHISQPSVSRHLRILREAGIIEERPIDNRIAYEVNHEKIENLSQQLMTYLHE